MDDRKRKDIIIQEIKNWKRHNLLPETYCDFLITLYTEGDEKNDPDFRKPPFLRLKTIYAIIFVHLLLLVTVVVIYFTDFSFIMQIAVVILCGAMIFFVAKKLLLTNKNFAHLFYLIGAITFFLLMIEGAKKFFPENSLAIAVTVLVNSFAWIAIGYKWKIKYFQIAGIVSVLLFIAYLAYLQL